MKTQVTNTRKQFCNVKIGENNRIFSDIEIINQFLSEGQKQVKFDELSNYCSLKKNQNFLTRKFKKLGFVPSFYVKNDMFYAIKIINYTHKGRTYESLSCLPVCSAYGRFNRFAI